MIISFPDNLPKMISASVSFLAVFFLIPYLYIRERHLGKTHREASQSIINYMLWFLFILMTMFSTTIIRIINNLI